jgi:acetylglutamate kinase
MAIALASHYNVKLIYCFEKNGVLSNPDDEASVINRISEQDLNNYKSKGVIHSGMIPKLDNAFAALKSGVAEIVICGPQAFQAENAIKGTTITL